MALAHRSLNGPARRFPQPMRNGEARPGGFVLIHGARPAWATCCSSCGYAPLVAERCAGVLLESPAGAEDASSQWKVRTKCAQGEPLPPFAAHVLIRLPAILRYDALETIPGVGRN